MKRHQLISNYWFIPTFNRENIFKFPILCYRICDQVFFFFSNQVSALYMLCTAESSEIVKSLSRAPAYPRAIFHFISGCPALGAIDSQVTFIWKINPTWKNKTSFIVCIYDLSVRASEKIYHYPSRRASRHTLALLFFFISNQI